MTGSTFSKLSLTALLTFILLLANTACVSLNSVSQTQIPAKRTDTVSAADDKFVILGFTFNNDFVDAVHRKLASKCKKGKITGILTKDESTNYFLGFVIKREVTATGYCLKG